eukprot:4491769-Amphidinium_carterae.3
MDCSWSMKHQPDLLCWCSFYIGRTIWARLASQSQCRKWAWTHQASPITRGQRAVPRRVRGQKTSRAH